MLASSVRTAQRPRCVKSTSLKSGALSSAALLFHRMQQTRGFRLGWYRWSYGGMEPRPDDMYRRCRKFRYKYTSSTTRDTTPGRVLLDDAESTSRRFMLWRTHGRVRRHSHKAQRTEGRTITPDNPEGVRPGQNIEDVERALMDHIIFGTPQTVDTMRAVPTTDADAPFTIDPITNRKVFVPSSASDVRFVGSNKLDLESLRPPSIDKTDAPPILESEQYLGTKQYLADLAARPLILESEQYLADLAARPLAGGPVGVEKKGVSWHPVEPFAASSQTPIAGRHSDHPLGFPTSSPKNTYDDLHKYDGFYSDNEPRWFPTNPSVYGSLKDRGHGSPESGGGYKETPEPPVDPRELEGYPPFRCHEPDGKYKVESEPTRDTSELKEYQPFRSHEPDGKYKERSEPDVEPSELEDYKPVRSHEPDGKYKARSEFTSDTSELKEYQPFRSHEPDGKYKERSEPDVEPSELEDYKPFRSHEPDGKYKQSSDDSVDPSELAKYEAFRAHEPDGLYAAAHSSTQQGLKEDVAYELERWYKYGLYSNEPDGKYAKDCNEPAADNFDLPSYGAFRSYEPDGKYAAEAAKATPPQALEGESFEYDLKGFEASDATPQEKTYYRQMLESLMSRSPEESNARETEPSLSPNASTCSTAEARTDEKPLTGNFVRDFPEEFAKAWTIKKDSNPTLIPTDMEEPSKITAAPGPAPSRNQPADLQPALDRVNTATSTLYKILVYDPVMQRIDTAETTSTVPDSATPLTPGDALLRISNPAKFMPHFGPLQSQGFEIVSGAGDVLVFRKVRESTSVAGSPRSSAAGSNSASADYTTAAGRFACPTGFVNYELPETSAKLGKPVRRVEPVFSGPKEKPKQVKDNKVKRLVMGAAWVAGVSYSIGVVGDLLGKGSGGL